MVRSVGEKALFRLTAFGQTLKNGISKDRLGHLKNFLRFSFTVKNHFHHIANARAEII